MRKENLPRLSLVCTFELFLSNLIGYLAFDIESPQNFDSTPLDSFQIGCASTVKSDGERKVWFSTTQSGIIVTLTQPWLMD
jgi:hypothetical protein